MEEQDRSAARRPSTRCESIPAIGVIPMPALASTSGRSVYSSTTSPNGADSSISSPTCTWSWSRLDTSPSGLPGGVDPLHSEGPVLSVVDSREAVLPGLQHAVGHPQAGGDVLTGQ